MCVYTYVVCTYVPPITIHRRIGEQTDVQKWKAHAKQRLRNKTWKGEKMYKK